ncbi:hypothetical protein HMPREF0201_02933 [Cedecea davisae DSM 4568]|uniref:Uncharacterized protein n=1 Tax=Cedecea davisae DSM 4568 TaxID=566551 RepID=S3JS63_9ENTR|nr:hypothetical protein HMPREF0201_02933 [Cedecea davisae DSM 4568]
MGEGPEHRIYFEVNQIADVFPPLIVDHATAPGSTATSALYFLAIDLPENFLGKIPVIFILHVMINKGKFCSIH